MDIASNSLFKRYSVSLLMGIHIFLSAFLLFQVQPLIAKIILPWFGGSAGVWAVCMLFFQCFLLSGYLLAHLCSKLTPKTQATLYSVSILVTALSLEVYPNSSWKPLADDNPTLAILVLLTAHIGAAYTLLAMTSPLIQSWFSSVFKAEMPYTLYSLSNLGSLLALVSYPIFIETLFTRQEQTSFWCYLFYGACVTGLLSAVFVSRQATQNSSTAEPIITTAVPFRMQLYWVLLAACGAALLLAITNLICNDIAAVPFLWVVPLTLYLLSFILTFASARTYWRSFYFILFYCLISWLVARSHSGETISFMEALLAGFIGLFAGCMLCHGELVKHKPAPEHLTQFYLLLSFGGAMGGIFVSLLAPLVFPDYFELHCTATLIVLLLGLPPIIRSIRVSRIKALIHILLVSFFIQIMGNAVWTNSQRYHEIDRNFYGTLKLRYLDSDNPDKKRLIQIHGNTIHGAQYQAKEKRLSLTSYYGPASGAGIAMRYLRPTGSKVGVLGLGAGVVAAFGRVDDTFHFFEINPLSIKQARKDFTFLAETPATTRIIEGDGRLQLERMEPQDYDILFFDAFSSDAIPVHLVTKEAFNLYRSHLKDNGLMIFNISNRYLDLRPIIFQHADDAGFAAHLVRNTKDLPFGFTPSEYILVAPQAAIFSSLPEDIFEKLTPASDFQERILWTDDFSNILTIVR